MKTLALESIRTILCLGAHSDDIEIGCGGTILRLLESPGVDVHWTVFSAHDEREAEARASASRFLSGARNKTIDIHRFRDAFFPYDGVKIKECFEELKGRVEPDLILTHHRMDLHQDHRTIAEFTWNTFRSHLILEYEIPKWDGDLGSPNLFCQLNASQSEQKVRFLLEGFPSQTERHWFCEETFLGLMRLRGLESNSPSGYAEGFYAKKVVL